MKTILYIPILILLGCNCPKCEPIIKYEIVYVEKWIDSISVKAYHDHLLAKVQQYWDEQNYLFEIRRDSFINKQQRELDRKTEWYNDMLQDKCDTL